MAINISKLFVKSGAFHILRIQSVAHALNNAYLHAHDSLVYCYSRNTYLLPKNANSSPKRRRELHSFLSKSKTLAENSCNGPHQRHHLLYPSCFSLEGCNRYAIITCGYFQYAKQVYDGLYYFIFLFWFSSSLDDYYLVLSIHFIFVYLV